MTNSLEKPAAWYDAFYARSEVHRMPTQLFDFYRVWCAAARWAKTNKHERITELGCGVGHFAYALQKEGWRGEYIGEDFSSLAIERASRRGLPGSFKVRDITRGTSEPAGCAVVAFEVLEHVEDDLRTLQRFPSRTPVCFSVPNRDAPGHVRFFPSVSDVKRRYSALVDIDGVKQFPFDDGETFFLVFGQLRTAAA